MADQPINAAAITQILNELQSSVAFGILSDKIASLGLHMNLPYHTREKIRKDLLQDRIEVLDALERCLFEWVQRESDKATLNSLQQVFEKAGLKDFSNVITERFINSQVYKKIAGQSTEDLETMIEKQRMHLDVNLPVLAKLCRCSPLFMATMTSRKVISEEDSQEVMAKATSFGQAIAFFGVLKTNLSSANPSRYDEVIKALRELRQDGAASVMELR